MECSLHDVMRLQRTVLRLGTYAGASTAFSLGFYSRQTLWWLADFCMLLDGLHMGGAMLVFGLEAEVEARMCNESNVL
jgi:hypothetical protein